jgi:hypothetical protein
MFIYLTGPIYRIVIFLLSRVKFAQFRFNATEEYIFLKLRHTGSHFNAITRSVVGNMVADCVASKEQKLGVYSCTQRGYKM